RRTTIVQCVGGIHILMTQRGLLERGQRMNDGISLHTLDGSLEVVAIHHICQDGMNTKAGEMIHALRGTGQPEHFRTSLDEGAGQGSAQSRTRSSNKHFHCCSFLSSFG